MLSLPPVGFSTSRDRHNCDIVTACDWVEANVMFAEEKISFSDVVDVLLDNEIYNEQDFATEFVTDIWAQLERRSKWLGQSSAYTIDERHIVRAHNWENIPGNSLCLMLALASYYKEWAKNYGAEYIKQGYLFERLTKESLQKYGWQVFHTGWSSGIQTQDFNTIVVNTAAYLNEAHVNEPVVALFERAKEEGLDLVCHKPFMDQRGGKPAYLVQCASGANWHDKLKEPDIDGVWRNLITFSSKPSRAFAMPFVVKDDQSFFTTCMRVEGMLLDRHRILAVGHDDLNWVDNSLKTEICDWLRPRIESFVERINETNTTPPAPPPAPATPAHAVN